MFNENINKCYKNFCTINDVKSFVEFDDEIFNENKMILDLPKEIVSDYDLYEKITRKIINKGFNISFKGLISNNDFGLPSITTRLIILAKKDGIIISLNKEDYLVEKGFIPPYCLIYSKNLDKIEASFLKYNKKQNISTKESKEMLKKVKDKCIIKDDCFKKLGIKGNLNNNKVKFKDGSNKKPKNTQKIRDNILPEIRLQPLDLINVETYAHFDKSKSFCSIREIARMNGYSDNIDLSMYNRKDFLFKVNNSLSPYIINVLWGSI